MKGLSAFRTKKYGFVLAIIIVLIILLRPPSLVFLNQPYSAIVNDSDGQLLSAHIAKDGQWRLPSREPVPNRFKTALLQYEDRRYHYHLGIDPIAVVRALYLNIKHGKVVSGASTITMQLARLSHKKAPRNLYQKLKEALLSVRIEVWHKKSKILQWYVSMAPFGGNVVGLKTAAWRYYGKSPDQLTWAEAATLAVLPNSPSLIHVNRNRSKLLYKRNHLLQSLLGAGHLDSLTYDLSILENLPDRLHALPRQAPHLLQSIAQSNFNPELNINRELQFTAHEVLNHLHQEWRQNEIQNGAVLILDNESGKVLTYIGNIEKTTEEKEVDMILARRSSGSILKPFLYAAMIQEGMIGPRSIIRDVPIFIDGFSPSNYNRRYSGYVHADEALQRSLNIPAVLMLRKFGIDPLLRKLKKNGITTLNKNADHYGLSLILGGGEVTLWEMAHAYRNLALSAKGTSNIYTPSSAFATLETLKSLRRPDEEGQWRRYESAVPIAWKTGTSYGHRDAWAIGVTPEITIATWVGNADGEGREGIVGSKIAGRLLFELINRMPHNGIWFHPPLEDMSWTYECVISGDLAISNCKNVDTLLAPISIGTRPVCKYHRMIFVDKTQQYRISENCIEDKDIQHSSYLDLDPIAAQYYKIQHPNYNPIPPLSPNCNATLDDLTMDIIFPSAGDKIYIPTDLNNKQQELIIKAFHKHQNAKIFWYLDDTYLGETLDWHSIAIVPSRGSHIITLVDQKGSRLSRQFEIIN